MLPVDINFGSPGIPIHFSLAGKGYVFAELSQQDDKEFMLWFGGEEDPDGIISGMRELEHFAAWLRGLPTHPHLNAKVSLHIENLHPELKGHYPGAEDFDLDACVGIVDEVKCYALGQASFDHPGELSACTRFPASAKDVFADIIEALIDAIKSGDIDLTPKRLFGGTPDDTFTVSKEGK